MHSEFPPIVFELHAPQLFGSVCRSVHANPPQSASLWPHGVHVPPTHVLLPPHTVPHVPQFSASVCVLTQVLLHVVGSLTGHTHWPTKQMLPPVHTIPQPPQLYGSIAMLSHSLRQNPHWPLPVSTHTRHDMVPNGHDCASASEAGTQT